MALDRIQLHYEGFTKNPDIPKGLITIATSLHAKNVHGTVKLTAYRTILVDITIHPDISADVAAFLVEQLDTFWNRQDDIQLEEEVQGGLWLKVDAGPKDIRLTV